MFKSLTAQARGVVVDAQEQARRMGHNWVGCEHLLLAVTGSSTSVGSMLNEAGRDA